MTASAQVMALIRTHYRRDEMGFAAAASALARAAKTPTLRDQIHTLIREGARSQSSSGGGSLQPMPPAPARPPVGSLYALPRQTFEDLLLDPELQVLLDEIVVELTYSKELARRNLRARSRFLFHGPPGNGKSTSAAALAHALDVEAYCVSIPEIVSIYVGGTGKGLSELFKSIRDGMVVVFDELDAIGSRRGSVDQAAGKEANAIINTLLTLLDRHQAGVIVGTTNRPDIVDPALLRRFDEKIEFPAPSTQQMESLAEKLCAKHEIPLVRVAHCQNLDEVTKTVRQEARRIVMRELLAADSAEDTDDTEDDGSPATH